MATKIVPAYASNVVTLRNGPTPYMLTCYSPFNERFKNGLHAYAGALWAPAQNIWPEWRAKKAWLVPIEGAAYVEALAKKCGLGFDVAVKPSDPTSIRVCSATMPMPGLYDFQRETAQRAIYEDRLLITFAMGLGKTATAIFAAKTQPRVLVLCPSSVRYSWVAELAKWAPECKGINVLNSKNDRPDERQWTIASYERVGQVAGGEPETEGEGEPKPAEPSFTSIILDEAHYLKNASAKRSKAVRELVEDQAQALKTTPLQVIALTGTPIANDPADLWHVLDLLWPGRYGTHFQFKRRYCQSVPNKYATSGSTYFGLNDARAPELRDRLKQVCSRVTQDDLSPGTLPPLRTQAIPVRPGKTLSQKDLSAMMTPGSGRQHESHWNGWLHTSAGLKIEAAVEQVRDAVEQGEAKICVLTHLKETARAIADELADLKPMYIDGDVDPKKREALIRGASRVVVATMHSVGTGINALADFRFALFAELAYYPVDMVQAIGRFNRLSSSGSALVRFLVVYGTIEEKIALSLMRKLTDQSKLLTLDEQAGGLAGALDAEAQENLSDWVTRMVKGAEESEEGDEDL